MHVCTYVCKYVFITYMDVYEYRYSTTHCQSNEDGLVAQLFALRDIEAGEELLQSYIDESMPGMFSLLYLYSYFFELHSYLYIYVNLVMNFIICRYFTTIIINSSIIIIAIIIIVV